MTLGLYIGLIVVLLALGWVLWAQRLSFNMPDVLERGDDTPAHLIRTLHNPIFNDRVTFLSYASESKGAYTLLEIELAVGGGNADHVHHRFSETFTALDGTLGVGLDGETHQVSPGQSLTVNPKSVHRFFNPTDQPIRFQVKIEPGSAGFEKALYLLYGLTQDGYANEQGLLRDFGHTALFLALSDTRAPGWLTLLNPLFKLKAQQMLRNGHAEALLQQYYFSHTNNPASPPQPAPDKH